MWVEYAIFYVGQFAQRYAGTSMLDLVDMLFARYGIQSLRYDGSMDRAAREAVLIRFRQPGGPSVILVRCAK